MRQHPKVRGTCHVPLNTVHSARIRAPLDPRMDERERMRTRIPAPNDDNFLSLPSIGDRVFGRMENCTFEFIHTWNVWDVRKTSTLRDWVREKSKGKIDKDSRDARSLNEMSALEIASCTIFTRQGDVPSVIFLVVNGGSRNHRSVVPLAAQ